jgi:hypothetical protein
MLILITTSQSASHVPNPQMICRSSEEANLDGGECHSRGGLHVYQNTWAWYSENPMGCLLSFDWANANIHWKHDLGVTGRGRWATVVLSAEICMKKYQPGKPQDLRHHVGNMNSIRERAQDSYNYLISPSLDFGQHRRSMIVEEHAAFCCVSAPRNKIRGLRASRR